MPKQFHCCEMFICCREMLYKNSINHSENFTQVNFNFVPASAQPGIAFSACVPSRQTWHIPSATLIRHNCFPVRPTECRILFSRFRDIWLESVVLIRLTTPNRKISQERACRIATARYQLLKGKAQSRRNWRYSQEIFVVLQDRCYNWEQQVPAWGERQGYICT